MIKDRIIYEFISRCFTHSISRSRSKRALESERLYRRMGFTETGKKKPVTGVLDEIEFALSVERK